MVGMAQGAGVYLNRATNRLRRVGFGLPAPDGGDWVLLSEDPNTSLAAARDLARQRQLSADAAAIQWE